MVEGLKIATIGGGSSYTPEFVEGLIKRYKEVPVRELWLVDIEEGNEKLAIVANLARRMVEKAGVPMEIVATLDRREALREADFVTTQMRVGQLQARIQDERIPLRYGMIGQETNGAGGLMKGLRTIPVLLEIAKEMNELCPNAWLINFTNPAGLVTEALLRYGKHQKVIGVCNLPHHTRVSVAKLLQVDLERVEIDFAGLNHMVYGLDIRVDGESVLAKVLKMLGDPEYQISMKNIAPIPWEAEFLKALGVLPCPYHRYYYKQSEILTKQLEEYAAGTTRAEVVQVLEESLFALYRDEELDEKPPQLEQRGGAYYSDAACNVISSIVLDKGDIQTLNVQNQGAIVGIPDESAVEVNCVVTKDGPKPVEIGELPVAVNGLVQQIKSFERVAAEAAVTGNYETALLAMTINPLVTSDEQAKLLLNEMLKVHSKYLPQFHQVGKQS